MLQEMIQFTLSLTAAVACFLLPLRFGVYSCIEHGLLPRRLLCTVITCIAQSFYVKGKAERPYRY